MHCFSVKVHVVKLSTSSTSVLKPENCCCILYLLLFWHLTFERLPWDFLLNNKCVQSTVDVIYSLIFRFLKKKIANNASSEPRPHNVKLHGLSFKTGPRFELLFWQKLKILMYRLPPLQVQKYHKILFKGDKMSGMLSEITDL